jgi:hypothetical protein
MEKYSKSKTTSRRRFTQSIVTAALTVPIAGSMVGCGSEPPAPPNEPTPNSTQSGTSAVAPQGDCPCTTTVRDGFTEIGFFGLLGNLDPEEHIPPMRIDGGGSLIIDSTNKLKQAGSVGGPFTYVEDGVLDHDRYGDIEAALVITEIDTNPFVKGVKYVGILPGAELWLWYQNISPSPVDPDDTAFPPVTFPDTDPDVRFIGGHETTEFKIVVKTKQFDVSQSHKKNWPHRFKHSSGGGMARHFRIGQWRLVNSTGATLVGDSGADNYILYVSYGEFQS